MNNDNGSDLLIAVLFAMSNQLRGLGPKSQDLVTPFFLGEGESLQGFTSELLQSEVNLNYSNIKKVKSATSQENK